MVWTVNAPDEMSRMISRGVDGIITDYPERVAQVLEARAGMSTAERLLLEIAYLIGVTPPQVEVPLDEQRI